MNVKKGGRVNPSISKGRDNFFVTKKNTTKPSNDSSGDNFFVQKKDPGKKNFNQHKEKFSQKGNSFVKRNRDNDQSRGPKEDVKKSFDKKKWRLQKYSKKYKLEQWGEKRKTAVLKDYHKQIEGDVPKLNVQKIYEEYAEDIEAQEDTDNATSSELRDRIEDRRTENVHQNNANKDSKNSNHESKQKKLPFKKARMEFQKKKSEKDAKKLDTVRRKSEREAALKQYKDNKISKFKKLNQKTKKGQPIMKARIEMLLEQIQASKASEN